MESPSAELVERLARVRLLALDVDGTLTDGGVRYAGDQEQVRFCVRDGQGLVWLRRELGLEVAWITGRGCPAVERRAAELGVQHLVMRPASKREALRAIQEQVGVGPDATLAMGDDLPDLGLAAGAAILCAPADARPEVRDRADLVTAARGGDGALREVAEALLRAQGAWERLLGQWSG